MRARPLVTIGGVINCPNCGAANPDGFKFCGNCAAPLAPAPAAREQRKTVTVLFCDVTGSTSLGESTDPEALRALLARYFERMKAIVESHGGTVEKFIGDAVMAVFGVPVLHEDDALRACRAAVEMRDALPALGIQARIGLNTGEVVTGTAERLATGDAVNVAARLQQAAAPQEILIGHDTYVLVETVVDAQEVDPLTLRGKAQPVPAYRLLGVTGAPTRRNEALMVGRVTELRRLRDAYDQAVGDRSCQLFTVLGNAGVGKSRVVHEFLDSLDAVIVTGVCLSYGEGITYWPVIDVVRQLTALRPALVLDENLASLLGEETFTAPSDQIAWAFRKLLEETAKERPLVVVFDDLQWAEPKFLDLIEHVADLSRDAPILLLCMARPDLLDRRPTWAGGKLNATNLLLEPLSGSETTEMVGRLLGGLSEHARERVVVAAEGNPLFAEEMVALVRESGDENVRVPPTIHALLAARLDQLDEHERQMLESGSIEGRLFHRGAVEALYPEERQMTTRLTALVRKDLVRPDKSELPGEDAFRFRHLLIRDAAYDAMPKSTRADLHERFARWLEEYGADLPEIDEILGYHLEQACLFHRELGQDVDGTLAARARERLAVAGQRALIRGDYNAGSNLLRRADDLPGLADVVLRMDLILSMLWGDQGVAAAEVAQRHLERAMAEHDRATELCARIEIEFLHTFGGPTGATERLAGVVAEATALFEETHDLRAMYVVHQASGQVANMRCDVSAAMQAFQAAKDLARQLGIDNDLVSQLALFRRLTAEPNTQSLAWFETEAAGRHWDVDRYRAVALAELGRFDEARRLLANEIQMAHAFGGRHQEGAVLAFEGVRVEMLAGDFAAAVATGEKGCRLLEEAGSMSILSTTAGALARAQFFAGWADKAVLWADRASELGDAEDVYTQALWRQAKGLVSAQRGQAVEAERLLLEAIGLAESTHSPVLLGEAYYDLGTAMALVGQRAKAAVALTEAIALYEPKENLVMAERARLKLAELGD